MWPKTNVFAIVCMTLACVSPRGWWGEVLPVICACKLSIHRGEGLSIVCMLERSLVPCDRRNMTPGGGIGS